MTWLNLTPLEFLAVFSVAASGAIWLYLLHQRPRRTVVATLRFWQSLEASPAPRRRRRIHQPWALLAQLLFLFLILMALANPLRKTLWSDRKLVILVDGSAWSQMQPENGRPWIEQIRRQSLDYLASVPEQDQVAIVRTDAGPAPVVPFTKDRGELRRAILALQPSDAAGDLPRALQLAEAAVAGPGYSRILYIGPGMTDESQAARLKSMRAAFEARPGEARLRLVMRLIGTRDEIENRGIVRLATRRDEAQPGRWHLLAQLRNYAPHPASVTVHYVLDGREIGSETVSIPPGENANSNAEADAAGGGVLEARLEPADGLAADNRALAWLPPYRPVQVAVITRDPKMLKPVLAANPFVQAEFVSPGQNPAVRPDIFIYDSILPDHSPDAGAIVFTRGTPTPRLRLTAWNAQHAVTRWIRTRDISVRQAVAFEPADGDAVLAWANGAPIVVARERGGHKQLLVGFDPRESNFPLQPAFPLLLAGAIEWIAGPPAADSQSFVSGEEQLSFPASRIVTPQGTDLPLARAAGGVHAIFTRAGLYHATTPEGSIPLAVNVPPLPSQRWKAGDDEDDAGDPPPSPVAPPFYYWRLLVLLAVLPLWAEWLLYYRRTRRPLALATRTGPSRASGNRSGPGTLPAHVRRQDGGGTNPPAGGNTRRAA